MEDAIQFAMQHGYFEHPTFLQLRSLVPDWLLELGTEQGAATLQSEYSVSLPSTVRHYVQLPELATVIEAGCDVNAFLNQMADCFGAPPPYVLYHNGHAHLVIAFHNHSGGVCAVDLDGPEPMIRFGNADLANFDLHPFDGATYNFQEWVLSCVRNANLARNHEKSRSFPILLD